MDNPRLENTARTASFGFAMNELTRQMNMPLDGLPEPFAGWFIARGWRPRPHQLSLLEATQQRKSMLLIAPTGAGKTLAGFLPALSELASRGKPKPGSAGQGLHTLYISPLKALAVDIERNLGQPVAEMELPIRIETRTGDTPQHKRQRQKTSPPDILLTTPEQLSLLLANGQAGQFFKHLRFVIFDELHSLVTSKRGHLLALALSRLRTLAPELVTIGLSATVADPEDLQRWLVGQAPGSYSLAGRIEVTGGAKPNITMLEAEDRIPWSGHSSRYAIPAIYEEIKRHKTALCLTRQYPKSGLKHANIQDSGATGYFNPPRQRITAGRLANQPALQILRVSDCCR